MNPRWTRLVLGGALLLSTACATSIDRARVAWSDGAGDFDEAERLYLSAAQDPAFGDIAREELVEIYLGLAKEQSRKNPEGASRYYAKALELEPQNNVARTGLARTYRDLGRMDDAIAVASDPKAKSCGECHRLEAILLVRRGDEAMAAGQWDAAEKDYGRAFELLPDPAVALAVVRARLATKNLRDAASGLESAAHLLDPEDATGRAQYLELRRAAVTLAVEKDDLALAEKLVDQAPPGVGSEVQLAIALEFAMDLRKKGKPDLAIERLQALVGAAEAGQLRLSEGDRVALRDRLAELYGARAAVALTSGRVDAAKADLDRALGLRPDDPSFKLQQVLVLAGRGKLEDARVALAKLGELKGHQQIAAILATLEVDQLLEQGKVKPAEAALERAKALGADLPEVHVAIAQLLAQTTPDLRGAELKELQGKGLISYPGGRVTRVGEALSELDWARQQIRGLGPAYPYRGPGTQERIDALQAKIRAFYRYEVRFQGDPTTVLVLRNPGSTDVRVSLKRGSFATDATVPAGGTKEVTIPKTGVVNVRYGGTDAVFLAEPYTQVELEL
jgi:tetratricopeptide (TPR) repeat protein